VGRHLDRVAVGESSHILMQPNVADLLRADGVDISPVDGEGRRFVADIDQPHGMGAVGKQPGPDLPGAVLALHARRLAQRILVDFDRLVIR